MLCPSCHIPNRDNAKFCKRCGHILAVEIVAAGQETQLAETLPGAMPPSQILPSDASGNAEPAGMSQQKTRSVPIQPSKDGGKAFGSHTTSKEMHSGSHTTSKDGGKAFGSHTTSKDGDPNALQDAFKGDPNALRMRFRLPIPMTLVLLLLRF